MTASTRQAAFRKKALRGFTLLEMILVIGLIMIVLAISGPAVTGYLTRSRLNAMNSDAKVIFTSAQTICQEFEFLDRNSKSSEFYGGQKDGSGKYTKAYTSGTVFIRFDKDGYNKTAGCLQADSTSHKNIISTNNNRNNAYEILGGLSSSAQAEAGWTANPDSASSSFIGRLAKLFPDMGEVNFVMAIENYTVKCVLCASSFDSEYVGAYPNKATEKAGSGVAYDLLSKYSQYSDLVP